MTEWLSFMATGFLFLFLAYSRASLWISTGAFAALFLLISGLGSLSVIWLILPWLLFLAVAIPFNIPSLRRKLLTDRLYHLARNLMPPMSATEREALEAGSVWWDGDLFSGRPNWKKLLNLPVPALRPEEKAFLDGPVEELCYMLDEWKITEELQDLPPEVWDFMKKKGFFGMIIPKEYNGLGFSGLGHSSVVMKVASRSISAAVTVMVPNSLGPAELLLNYGTKEQKNHYLPRLARGEDVPCFALTGPEAGSDAASLPDKGVVCRREFSGEKDVLGIRLNWEKRYITLGPSATVLGLAFKLCDPDALLGGKEEIGITLALIPTGLPGITIGSRHFPLNSAFLVGPTWGKDVFIPLDFIIGGPQRAGKGWAMLMECLAVGRSISLPALSTGSGKLASRLIGAYARIRRQFKLPIGRFEGVEEGLARIGGYTYLMDAARSLTTTAVDEGEKPSVISAMVKYNLTEKTRKAINDAMDIQGGAAICMGPRNILARLYQSLPISITVEGSNILTRNMIVFGQGAIRCHPYLLKVMNAVHETDKERGMKEFDKAIMGHVGFSTSNAVRSFLLGLTGSMLAFVPGIPSATRIYYQHASRMCAAFALAADVALLVLGGALKRKERLSARLADIFSHLYLISAVLKRYEDQGRPPADLPLVRWACQDSLNIIQESFYAFLKNFPNLFVSGILRFLCFPLGRPFPPPGDKLDHQVASLLLSPSSTRDRLTCGIFIPKNQDEPLGLLEDALKKAIAAEPVEKKILQAIKSGDLKGVGAVAVLEEAVKSGLVSEEEAMAVEEATSARKEVIKVDDFPKDWWDKKVRS